MQYPSDPRARVCTQMLMGDNSSLSRVFAGVRCHRSVVSGCIWMGVCNTWVCASRGGIAKVDGGVHRTAVKIGGRRIIAEAMKVSILLPGLRGAIGTVLVDSDYDSAMSMSVFVGIAVDRMVILIANAKTDVIVWFAPRSRSEESACSC